MHALSTYAAHHAPAASLPPWLKSSHSCSLAQTAGVAADRAACVASGGGLAEADRSSAGLATPGRSSVGLINRVSTATSVPQIWARSTPRVMCPIAEPIACR